MITKKKKIVLSGSIFICFFGICIVHVTIFACGIYCYSFIMLEIRPVVTNSFFLFLAACIIINADSGVLQVLIQENLRVQITTVEQGT